MNMLHVWGQSPDFDFQKIMNRIPVGSVAVQCFKIKNEKWLVIEMIH